MSCDYQIQIRTPFLFMNYNVTVLRMLHLLHSSKSIKTRSNIDICKFSDAMKVGILYGKMVPRNMNTTVGLLF